MTMRYIKIDYNGYIFPIKTNGPIVTPLAMDEKVALRAVIDGYRCTEVDIKSKKEAKLTIENFYNADRFGKIENHNEVTKSTIQVNSASESTSKMPYKTAEVKTEDMNLVDESNSNIKETETTDIDLNDTASNKTYNYNDNYNDKKNKNKK